MQNAMFSGVFAALTSEHRMAIISNNLANVNTVGYKADTVAFKDTMIHFAHDFIREPLENLRSKPLFPEAQQRARVRLAVEKTDFTQGGMQYTGNPLDIAITGEGFFRIQTPNGDFLSRNGAFCQNARWSPNRAGRYWARTAPSRFRKERAGSRSTAKGGCSRTARKWPSSIWWEWTGPRGWKRWGPTCSGCGPAPPPRRPTPGRTVP